MSTRALAAVFEHSTSRGSARLVLLAMADEANDEGLLTAYRRSYSWLARKANVDTSTVKRAVRDLQELGELVVLAAGDGRASSNYRLVLPDLRQPENEGGQPAHPGGAARPPRGGQVPTQGGPGAPPIIPFLPGTTPSAPTTRAADAALAAAFEQFWTAYPRSENKAGARKLWPAAVKAAGSTEVVVEGAKRYAADPNREQAYTAHATTWLRAERWNDPPLPPRPGRGQAAPRPVDTDREAPSGRLEL